MNTPISDNTQDHRRFRAGSWVGGAILIAIGVMLLVQNFTGFYLHNWWALFILIPAAGMFGRALECYQNTEGRFSAQVRGALFSGTAMTLIAAGFLFGLNWAILGPVFLLLAGSAILINTLLPVEH